MTWAAPPLHSGRARQPALHRPGRRLRTEDEIFAAGMEAAKKLPPLTVEVIARLVVILAPLPDICRQQAAAERREIVGG